ncbi:MAG TPA: hypothetical protein VIZ31_08195 [Vicinamibacteria bacterium]
MADEGEDGVVLGVPEGLETRLPTGETLFQFKTNGDRKTVEGLVLGELDKSPRPMKMLESGGSYVVVWSKDSVGKEHDALRKAIREKVGADHEDRVDVWSVGVIEELLTTNPAALIEFGMVGGMSVLTFDQWAPGERQSIPNYVPDQERSELIEQLQRVIIGEAEAQIAHLQGDAGVGKTRLILEALDKEEIHPQVIYGTPGQVAPFISYVVSLPDAHCILFIDEVDPTELDYLRRSVQPALGRIRLITAGLPGDYRSARPSGNNIELGRLNGPALVELVREQIGLPEAAARWVADLSEGYPRLAIEVAKLIQAESDTLSIADTIASLDVQLVLDKMLPADDLQERLGTVALFSQVGVEGPRGVELDAIADAFGIDRAVLLQTLSDEEGRFVSRAGALRSVTPRLIAIWLASKVLGSKGTEIAAAIQQLPEPLPARFRDQLVYLREAPTIRVVVDELLKRPEFQEPAAFDEAAAGFLRAAAAANPEQVAGVLRDLFTGFDDEALRGDDFPRRDVVWALEQLLWPEFTYETAVDLLLRLAETETEAFANNATGVLTDSFQVHLGGTEAPYQRRLHWLDSKLEEDASDAKREILAVCLASGLRGHQVRSHGSRPDETGVRDWHPSNWEEDIAARRGAWERLARVVSEAAGGLREAIFPKLSDGVRETMGNHLADVVLDTLLDGDWTPDERAKLAAGLRDVLKYDKPDAEWRERTEEAIRRLSGESLAERARVALRTPIWDLHEDDDWEKTPRALRDLAEEIASDLANVTVALEATEELEDQGTAYSFWREVSKVLDPKELALQTAKRPKAALVAYQAALSVAQEVDPAWVDEQLQEAMTDRERAQIGVQLIQSVGITDDRARLLLNAVSDGRVPPESLTQLLYGASVRRLSPELGLRVVEAAADAGTPVALEHALGMLHQYTDVDEDFLEDPERRALAIRLATSALSAPGGTNMKYHYAYELANLLPIEDALTILRARLVSQRTLPEPAEVELMNSAFDKEPEAASGWARDLLAEAVSSPYPEWAFWTESFHLLTRAARSGGADETWAWFKEHDESAQIRLVRHLDFGLQEPDEFLTLLLEECRSDVIRNEASAAYFNSLGTVAGPFHLGLQRQLDRIRAWRERLAGAGREWADEQIEAYKQQIPRQRRREEEEDALLR